MLLLDASVMIEILKNSKAGGDALLTIGDQEVGMSTLTRFEILEPLKDKELEEMKVYLKNIPLMNFDENCAERAAELSRKLRSKGKSIGIIDTLIAGTCLKQNHSIATFDKHFKNIDGLTTMLFKF